MIEIIENKSTLHFQKQLNSILKKAKVNINQLAQECKINPASLYHYRDGSYKPSIKNLNKLQDFCDKKNLKIKLKKDW